MFAHAATHTYEPLLLLFYCGSKRPIDQTAEKRLLQINKRTVKNLFEQLLSASRRRETKTKRIFLIRPWFLCYCKNRDFDLESRVFSPRIKTSKRQQNRCYLLILEMHCCNNPLTKKNEKSGLFLEHYQSVNSYRKPINRYGTWYLHQTSMMRCFGWRRRNFWAEADGGFDDVIGKRLNVSRSLFFGEKSFVGSSSRNLFRTYFWRIAVAIDNL